MLFEAKFNHLVGFYLKITIESKKKANHLNKFGRFTIGKMLIISLFFRVDNVLYTMYAKPYNII